MSSESKSSKHKKDGKKKKEQDGKPPKRQKRSPSPTAKSDSPTEEAKPRIASAVVRKERCTLPAEDTGASRGSGNEAKLRARKRITGPTIIDTRATKGALKTKTKSPAEGAKPRRPSILSRLDRSTVKGGGCGGAVAAKPKGLFQKALYNATEVVATTEEDFDWEDNDDSESGSKRRRRSGGSGRSDGGRSRKKSKKSKKSKRR